MFRKKKTMLCHLATFSILWTDLGMCCTLQVSLSPVPVHRHLSLRHPQMPTEGALMTAQAMTMAHEHLQALHIICGSYDATYAILPPPIGLAADVHFPVIFHTWV